MSLRQKIVLLIITVCFSSTAVYAEGSAEDHFGMVGNTSSAFGMISNLTALVSAMQNEMQNIGMEVDSLTDELPEVESCCVTNEACREDLEKTDKFMKTVFNQLEKNYRVYYITMEKYRLRKNAMASIGKQSAPAGATVAALEASNSSTSINASKKKFFNHYDSAQKDLLEKLKKALNKVNQLEQQYCGQANWLKMHGFTLLIALRSRYERPGAAVTEVASEQHNSLPPGATPPSGDGL